MILAKKRKTKKIPRQDQTKQKTKKNLPTIGGEWAKPYQQLDAKETRRFWSKIWEQKDHIKKVEWI